MHMTNFIKKHDQTHRRRLISECETLRLTVFSVLVMVLISPPLSAITPEGMQSINLGETIYYDDGAGSEVCYSGGLGGGAQTEAEGIEAYTERYGQIAFDLGEKHGIPYEVILAQSAHESAWGGSGLTENAYNFFGIKAGSSWNGPVYTTTTWEVIDGEDVEVDADFRMYENSYAGFLGYVHLIYNAGDGSTYSEALEHPNDAHRYLEEVANAGYATDPAYINRVSGLIDQFKDHIADNNLFPPSSELSHDSMPPPESSAIAAGACEARPSGERFIHYSQCDSEWDDYPLIRPGENSYMCRGGCGPAAIAMVLANMYDADIDPVDVADYSNDNGYHTADGSSWALMDNAPEDLSNNTLQVNNYGGNLDRALNVLNEGGLVIATGKDSPPPYTEGGHIIVIREALSNGNFLVGDSADHNSLDHEYSYSEINNGRNYWGVTRR